MKPRVAALIPCHDDAAVADVVERTLPHVDELLVVADAPPAATRRALHALAGRGGVCVTERHGEPAKGSAMAFGARRLLAQPLPPDHIVIVDADGQHPPERIPAFVAAARQAQIVVGTRRRDRSAMPHTRRLANDVSSALLSAAVRRRLPDTQCGMRLLTGDALRAVPLPPGGFDAETRHLAAAARAGLRVAWVPIPAIYAGEHSDFHPVRDSLRILQAILAAPLSGTAIRGQA